MFCDNLSDILQRAQLTEIFHEFLFISLKNSECVRFLGYLRQKTEKYNLYFLAISLKAL